MSQVSEEYYTTEELRNIAIQNGIDEVYIPDFISRVEHEIDVMISDGELTKPEIGSAAITFSLEYILKFNAEVQKGHSRRWAELYADNPEEHHHAFNDTYLTLKGENADLAVAELKIHCGHIGGDELYEKHLIFLMDNGEGALEPDKTASSYSKIYKEQAALGKSEIYCHHYADQMADETSSEAYCFTFARCFDEAIREGRSENYARIYAIRMGDYYGDQYSLGSKIKYDEVDLINEAEIKQSMAAIS